ncbi:MAG: exodeoxyribonuclease VII large subunit [Prevotella sp.]
MNTLSLFELTSMVSMVVAESLPEQYWVEAEVMSVQERNGHCFMQFVQKDMLGATPVAQASAKCWRSQWMPVAAKFQRVTGSPVSQGMHILARVKVEFHPTYGFSLIVSDIDPVYTMGEMARRRQEIIQQLKDEGVFDLQRELSLPLFCQRIAVISSPAAAGYGDFCNQLENNEYGFHFDVTLFPAVMQGEQVERTVCDALDSIYNVVSEAPALSDATCFDCVVIIRGGGAVADMSGFDTLRLAENVANFPLPVITGIGHDRDESILDMVSCRKVKTPTAAAALLIDRLATVLGRIEDAQSMILSSVSLAVERQKKHVDVLSERIVSNVTLHKTREQNRLERLFMTLTNAVSGRMLRDRHQLDILERRLEAMDPEILLKRGFSMTLHNGHIVKDSSQLQSGEEIETVLAKGKVKSIVR